MSASGSLEGVVDRLLFVPGFFSLRKCFPSSLETVVVAHLCERRVVGAYASG